jgi:peptide-methionine (S)-S-oxide reductase
MIRSLSIGAAVLLIAFLLLSVVSRNSATAAVTVPNPVVDDALASAKGERTLVVAGGCFWGIQAVFEHVKGVVRATAGYSGGSAKTADYETVSSGTTGHAESVEVVYDPSQITLGQLLKVFFSVAHDPTELNHQGPDDGTQYRSVIFFSDENQQKIAKAYIDQLSQAKVFRRPIVTQVVGLTKFYKAEAHHQDYAVKHPDDPYIAINDLPKVEHLRQQCPDLYRSK